MSAEYTTPLEREILTHYWLTNEHYLPPQGLRDVHKEAMQRFVDLGLLRMADGRVEGNPDALAPYMEALAAVPLPVQRWTLR